MVSQEFKDYLEHIYLSECLGEAMSELALTYAESERERYILGAMLQLETEAKAAIRPILMKYDLPMNAEIEDLETHLESVHKLFQLPWAERFEVMAEEIRNEFVDEYNKLALLVTEEEDAEAYKLAVYIGNHEEALLSAVENVIAGKENPMAPVNALLKFPLIEPSN